MEIARKLEVFAAGASWGAGRGVNAARAQDERGMNAALRARSAARAQIGAMSPHGRKLMTGSFVPLKKFALAAALGLVTLGAGVALAPSQAEARHRDRHWVAGSGLDFHYRPARRGHHWGHHRAPVYGYGYGHYRPIYRDVYRPPAYGYYAPAYRPAYFYGEHCVVKKKWRGFHRVRRVVCT